MITINKAVGDQHKTNLFDISPNTIWVVFHLNLGKIHIYGELK